MMMNKVLRLCINHLANKKPVNYETCRHIKRWVSPTQIEITRRKRQLRNKQEPPKRNAFIEWNRNAELYAFNQRLSENFLTNKLNQALVHKSFIFEEEKKAKPAGFLQSLSETEKEHNDHLIKAGEELISKIVQNYLQKYFPKVPEDGILAFQDYLMSQEILATASLHIGTRDLILTAEHPVSEETLANTFLALVAALAESTNIERASLFVRDFLIVGLACKDLTEIWTPPQPYEMLDNLIYREKKQLIEPRLIAHTGNNTLLSCYQVGIYSNKKLLGSGFGQTVDEAKTAASLNALYKIFGLLDSSFTLRFDQSIDVSNITN